ncbi:ABC transporter permease subunit [Finegoldia magna]|uniref:ABC transporter permease subunit n=1 Tax=Finegoldia magna TaxID=1260 RepID=UPI000B918768|nr:ABC transporter permease subunit [Finegoldia magna]MDU2132498.1 ABC transporter permease subunit [Finegoldia magna]MDU2218817.1 ABC transporter permease subunit [Finegoldia magna]MDU4278081.1 ABC transporter permease subunit [Finegoldia magna]MDU5070598.1 ABC transporter permease subunit [Finegoldia magna]MDU6552072.1 ABC transporter permease subunit [Finegoldia magna]
MKRLKNTENWIIWTVIFLIFVVFLFYPLFLILLKSLKIGPSIKIDNFTRVLSGNGFVQAMKNSFEISAIASLITTFLSFIIAYTINYTNLNTAFKKIISVLAVLPMLLPTITYGFAIIYSFGKQGLFTKLLGKQLFHVYGKNGLLIGYIIYTLPISFMLINNTMKYVDKKFSIVSKIMGDSTIKTFIETVLRPLTGTFAASFIQCFFLCFTDFGIPASVGGKVEVIASVLYKEMLGSVPNLNNGAVVAVIMLLPSVISILIINYLERFNVRYNRISVMENEKNTSRDVFCGIFSVLIVLGIIAIFAVIAIVPFVKGWPYNMVFTMDNVNKVIEDSDLLLVYKNSIIVAIITSVLGTILVYGAAIVTDRSSINSKAKGVIESIASVTNTIPGMVLGISFMLAFIGTSLQNTFIIIIICNLVHFFATPYMMMKNSLSKMNLSWEKTAKLMGDSWIKTIVRIITPNALTSLLEVFSYYFINAMVTVSAVVFLAGARTMVITTKIKELQHFAKFNEIFVLSLLILFTNLLAKIVFTMLVKILERKNN